MSVLSLIFAFVILAAVFCWLTGYRFPVQLKPSSRQGRSHSSGRVNRATRQQLMRLVNGNQAVADRLIARVRSQNPDRSEQWWWEKAIYDIQRDRRA